MPGSSLNKELFINRKMKSEKNTGNITNALMVSDFVHDYRIFNERIIHYVSICFLPYLLVSVIYTLVC